MSRHEPSLEEILGAIRKILPVTVFPDPELGALITKSDAMNAILDLYSNDHINVEETD